MTNNEFVWLIQWFDRHCDGDWEHQYGIELETLDNPGWSLKITIQETELQDKQFEEIAIERSESDWIFCKTNKGFFEGNCGVHNLPELIQNFREWAES